MGSSVSSSRRSSLADKKHRNRSKSEDSNMPKELLDPQTSGQGSRPSSRPGSRPSSRPVSRTGSPSRPVSRDLTPKGSPRLSRGDVLLETKTLDLMISYSHADTDMMNKIKDSLEENGIRVWVDVIGLGAGVDFLSKIGQAIIDSKLFVSLLSEKSVESKYCQDELALAYVSNKPIIPVALEQRVNLLPKMDTGMRLQLAGFHWHMFLEEEKYDENMINLVTNIKEALDKVTVDKERKLEDKNKTKTEGDEKPAPLKRQTTRYQFYTRSASTQDGIELSEKQSELADAFWIRHFGQLESIDYVDFVKKVQEDFQSELDEMYSQQDQTWLMNLLRRELEVEEDGLLLKGYLLSFCTVDDVMRPLWLRIEDQARESYAMREVFNMDSSVRVEAIENLGKFKSLAVVDALRDLLDDDDPNVRTVAAVSIAKTGSIDKLTIKKLLKILNDKDRLVREAGCIALGRLKAEHAVPRLVHMWRNDVISSVRDAAELALSQIGGPIAEKAMHITKILAEEIRMMAKQSS